LSLKQEDLKFEAGLDNRARWKEGRGGEEQRGGEGRRKEK
jgi:hypothetical protein